MTVQEKLADISYKGPGFDRIRLIAAMIVVLHHCSIYIVPQIAHDWLFRYSHGFINFGLFAVTVFFSLSGFLVSPGLFRTGDVFTFAVHRFLRIIPALAASVFVAMFVVGPLLTVDPLHLYFADRETYRYLKNLVFLVVNTLPGVEMANGELIIINGALWTLYFEVLCYASLVMMSLSGVLAKRGYTFGVFIAIYVVNALLWYCPSLHSVVPDRIETFVNLFVYFASGVCIFQLASTIPWSLGAATMAASSMLVGLPLGIGVLVMPICLPYLVVYVGLSRVFGRAQYKNDYSYGIYIFHAQVLTFVLIMFPSLRSFFVAAPVVALVSLFIAVLSWNFIEAPALNSKRWASAMVRKNLDLISSTVGHDRGDRRAFDIKGERGPGAKPGGSGAESAGSAED